MRNQVIICHPHEQLTWMFQTLLLIVQPFHGEDVGITDENEKYSLKVLLIFQKDQKPW